MNPEEQAIRPCPIFDIYSYPSCHLISVSRKDPSSAGIKGSAGATQQQQQQHGRAVASNSAAQSSGEGDRAGSFQWG